MAWTDEFNDVAWTNGDYLSEIKLDQMVANERWAEDQLGVSNIRGPADYPHLGLHNYSIESYLGIAFGSWVFEVLINTTVIYTNTVTSDPGWVSVESIGVGSTALTAVTDGTLFELSIKWTRSGYAYVQDKIKLVKNQSFNYLSFGLDWTVAYYNFDPDGVDYDYRRPVWKNSWFIGHAGPETW